ncbi:hypothetical protein BC830DRAFT_487655 [Chytriomyces sp. MP71]|nr:hypothetical protein BC830DRAFT_487655 [Chytriomyces sp. MP71]
MTSHMSRSQSQTRQQLNRAPSMALSEASTSFSNDPNSQRNASISSRVSRSSLKSSTGWSGKASQRQSNKISDLIIDEACNLEHETIPMSVMATVIGMIREYYSTPTNKGAGANQAIMAVLFVCNLDDPAFVRKSMEVLDVLYHSCGPVFVLNLGLNLDFFQHFFETRKHRSPAERDNITFLCGLFAKWYSIQPTFEELALAGNLQDPTVKIRQFFEGLYRAGYDFPSHSLDHFPPDKLVAIKSSWMSSGVSFKRVKSQKGTPTPVPAEAPAMTRSQSALSRSSSGKNGPTKSPTGWSGRSSQRQAGKIADLIIDELCSLDYETAPLEATAAVIELVEEHYQQPKNKGAGANQVIMAIMYVCNLEDPAYVRRSLKVLDIMYKNCGPVFWINLSLNLDFYQHFLETRKHTTVQERDNIKYLCGIFAGWYLLEASKEELAVVAMTSDPSVKVKQFFEGLVRAGYEFPEGSLSRIPADKMASITTWSMMRGGFSFASVRK